MAMGHWIWCIYWDPYSNTSDWFSPGSSNVSNEKIPADPCIFHSDAVSLYEAKECEFRQAKSLRLIDGANSSLLHRVIVFSLIHLHYLHNLKSTDDPGIASGSALTWQEVELTYSLAATTLITLKSFTREFDTGFGLGGEIFRTHGTNTVGYIGSSTSTASRTKQGVGENIKLEVRRGTSLQLQGIVADELAAAVNSNKRVSGSHGFKQIDSVLNGVGRTTTTVSHDPRGSLSTAQGDGRNEGDAIMVTHQVEQVIHPRHVV